MPLERDWRFRHRARMQVPHTRMTRDSRTSGYFKFWSSDLYTATRTSAIPHSTGGRTCLGDDFDPPARRALFAATVLHKVPL